MEYRNSSSSNNYRSGQYGRVSMDQFSCQDIHLPPLSTLSSCNNHQYLMPSNKQYQSPYSLQTSKTGSSKKNGSSKKLRIKHSTQMPNFPKIDYPRYGSKKSNHSSVVQVKNPVINNFIQQTIVNNDSFINRYNQIKKQTFKIDKKMFLNLKVGNIKDHYFFQKRIGEGSFGVVYKAKNRKTEQQVAIKAIVQANLKDPSTFLNECQIMIKMDHPNIVKLQEIWEWENLYFLVMDYYEGGNLYDHLQKRGYFEEFEVYTVMKQIIATLIFMGENSIQHKDLKLENFLLKNVDDLSNLKVIDFGLSEDMSLPNHKQSSSGTPFYVAPETLMFQTCMKSDVWSLGVIMYLLLSGKMPFTGLSSDQILKNVMAQKLSFNHPSFSQVSSEAKQLISMMIDRNIVSRISQKEILQHPWCRFFEENNHTFTEPKKLIEKNEIHKKSYKQKIFSEISSFKGESNMSKMIMVYLANRLNEDMILKLRQVFIEVDTNKNGNICNDELNEFFKDNVNEVGEIKHIFEALDMNQNGKLEYSEFIAATLRKTLKDKLMRISGLDHEELLQFKKKDDISKKILESFNYLDVDQTGFISRENLATFIDDEFVDIIIQEVDTNGDGLIDLKEFLDTFLSKIDQDQQITQYIIEYFNV